MDPQDDDPTLTQAYQDVSTFLNGTDKSPQAQAAAQAAQSYINSYLSHQPKQGQADTPDDKLARQQAREDYQRTRDAASQMDRQYLQGQKDTAAGDRLTQKDTDAAARQQAGIGAAADRVDAQQAGATNRTGMRDDTSLARQGMANEQSGANNAATNATSAANNAATNTTRLQVAQQNAAAKVAAIQQQAQAKLDQLDKQFQNQLNVLQSNEALKKDLYAFQSQLQMARDEHLQQAMQIRQEALNAQQDAYNEPFKQAAADAEAKRAQTESDRLDWDKKNAQLQMQMGAARSISDEIGKRTDEGLKYGVAPPLSVVKMQFAPFMMAQQVLQQMMDGGQVSPDRVPDLLGMQPTPGSAGASGGGSPPLGGFDQGSQDAGSSQAPPPMMPQMPFAQSGFPEGFNRGAPLPVGGDD